MKASGYRNIIIIWASNPSKAEMDALSETLSTIYHNLITSHSQFSFNKKTISDWFLLVRLRNLECLA